MSARSGILIRVGGKSLLSSQLTSRLWHAGLLALGILVACGGSASRIEPDASPQGPSGGTESNHASTGGDQASTGGVAVPTRAGGPSEGGAPAEGGAVHSGGSAGVAGAGSGGAATSMSGAGGRAGSVSSGGMEAAGSGGEGGAGPVHDRCADPLQIDFVSGEATVSDDTSRATDEFPTLTCGDYPEPGFQGGQIYYRFTARPGREYALSLKAPSSFASVAFYVFPAGDPCDVEAIRTACSSEGVTGTRPAMTPATLTPFAPREPGDYIIGVDTTLTKGSPFTLSVFEYCGTSGGTDCKVKGCDLNLGKTCLGNTASACNDDGTATVTTDCATLGKSCQSGFCVASIFDNVTTSPTSPAMTAGAAGVTLLDFYEATTSRTLTKFDMIMVQPRSFRLDWLILESTDRAGPYQPIFTTTTMSAGAMEVSSETAGPIQVPIVAGRFYAIGVALPAGAQYYLQQQAEKSLPMAVYFGWLTSAAVVQSASSSAAIGYPAPGDFLIAQGITTKL